jgi:hypothetical protein
MRSSTSELGIKDAEKESIIIVSQHTFTCFIEKNPCICISQLYTGNGECRVILIENGGRDIEKV